VTDAIQDEFESEFRSRIDAQIGTITLNRPNLGNALTRAMMIRLANHIRTLSARATFMCWC